MNILSDKNNSTIQNLTILCADIYEYTKLTNQDQVNTHKNLKSRFKILERVIDENNGNIIRMFGDSVLISFEDARNAIYCAAEIQRASQAHNFKLELNQELLFRIGIAYGEVICEHNEPYGNAVNIAKRLEELAKPGGIYIADDVFNNLDIDLPFPTNFRGRIRVKNVDDAVIVHELSQYEPLSIKKNNRLIFNHPIDRSYLGTVSILILATSIIVLAVSVTVLISTLSILN